MEGGVNLRFTLFMHTIQGRAKGSVLDFFVFSRFASLRAKRSNPESQFFWIASSYLLAMTRSACGSKALNL